MTYTLLTRTNTEAGRIQSFVNFVMEREKIRIQKEADLPRPWTKDPVLQTYSFCNVRRADDRVTKWIGEWVKKNARNKNQRWFWYCVARWINSPETLDELTPTLRDGWDARKAIAICKEIKAQGRTVMRGSYIINSAYSPGIPKYKAIIEGPLNALWKEPPDLKTYASLHGIHTMLMNYIGHGSFMAGQIVADWQTFGVVRGVDVDTWAPLGPGSNRGLKWIFADEYIKREYCRHMIGLREALWDEDPDLADSLTLHDVQNCLCEFFKYVRGYAKAKYTPYQESFI